MFRCPRTGTPVFPNGTHSAHNASNAQSVEMDSLFGIQYSRWLIKITFLLPVAEDGKLGIK